MVLAEQPVCCGAAGDTVASLSMEILPYISSRLLPSSPLQQSHRVQEVQVPQGGSPGLGRPAFWGATLHGARVGLIERREEEKQSPGAHTHALGSKAEWGANFHPRLACAFLPLPFPSTLLQAPPEHQQPYIPANMYCWAL